MPKILKNALLGVGAFLMLLLAIIVVYETVFAFFGGLDIADGQLTKGDILTSVSIAVAALGAIGGWVLTSQHRQDDIVRLAEKERKVIEYLAEVASEDAKRIAEADALILYRRLKTVEASVIELLVNFLIFGDKILVVHFAKAVTGNDAKPNYQLLEKWATEFLPQLPDTDELLQALRPLYVYDQSLGDKFENALRQILMTTLDLNYYIDRPLSERVTRFQIMPNAEKQFFFSMLAHVVQFLIEMEVCRRALNGVEFSPPLFNSDLLALKEILEQLHGEKIVMKSKTSRIHEDAYMQMLQVAYSYFLKESFQFSRVAASV